MTNSELLVEGLRNEQGNNVSSLAGAFGEPDLDAYSGLSDGGEWDLLDAAHAGFFGDIESDLDLSVRDSEESNGEPQDSDHKLVYAPLRNFSEPRKRGRKQPQTMNIGPDDYEEGPERAAFMMIYERVRACYLKQITPDVRMEAINWVFSVENTEDISFALCCRVLGVRDDIIRLRLHYQFFLNWLVFPRSFSFFTSPLPDQLSGEVLYKFGEEGFDVAREAWNWPGISRPILFDRAAEKWGAAKAQWAIEHLEESGALSEIGDHFYLTGRNPSLMGKNAMNFRWSALWGKY